MAPFEGASSALREASLPAGLGAFHSAPSVELGSPAALAAAAFVAALLSVMVATLRQRGRVPDEQDSQESTGLAKEEETGWEGCREEASSSEGISTAVPRRKPLKAKGGAWQRPSRDTMVIAGLLIAASALLYTDTMWKKRLEAMTAPAPLAGPDGYRCTPLSGDERLRHFGNLEGFTHPISTASTTAQRHFDQGLVNLFNFNQGEAHASFRAALEEDPSCAMCHWGLACASGPFVNKVEHAVDSPTYPSYGPTAHKAAAAEAAKALELARDAVSRASGASSSDGPSASSSSAASAAAARDLKYAEALAVRFGAEAVPGAGYEAAELEYSAMMLKVAEEDGDVDARALAAEALVNTVAWDYYGDRHGGSMKPAAAEGLRLCEAVLEESPMHPLALHLVVHLKEQLPAGRGPGKAGEGEAAADRLVVVQPGMGHLVHMAAHLYLRVGRYWEGVQVSIMAVKRDYADSMSCLKPYATEHNIDMLLWHASMSGEYATAVKYAERQRMYADGEINPLTKFPGRLWTNLILLQAKFGMWNDILASDPPTERDRGSSPLKGYEFANAVWRFGRFMALAAKISDTRGLLLKALRSDGEEMAAVRAEAAEFRNASSLAHDSGLGPTYPGPTWNAGRKNGLFGGAYSDLVEHASAMVEARLAALDGDLDSAVAHLQKGAALEDEFEYMEPPRFFQPILPCLGKVLMDSGRYLEAEKAFRKDLESYPNNAWSLLGLGQSFSGQESRRAESQAAFTAHAGAWARADEALRRMRTACPSMTGSFKAIL